MVEDKVDLFNIGLIIQGEGEELVVVKICETMVSDQSSTKGWIVQKTGVETAAGKQFLPRRILESYLFSGWTSNL